MYPHKWRLLTQEEELDSSDHDQGKMQTMTVVGDEDGLRMPKLFTEACAEKIYNMKVCDDDIWVVTYPKCGTTWTQVKNKTIVCEE